MLKAVEVSDEPENRDFNLPNQIQGTHLLPSRRLTTCDYSKARRLSNRAAELHRL